MVGGMGVGRAGHSTNDTDDTDADIERNRRAEMELTRLSLFVGTAHGRFGIAVAGVVMTKSKAAVMATSAVTAIATLARIYTAGP